VTINIIFNVNSEDAELNTVKLYSGLIVDLINTGNDARATFKTVAPLNTLDTKTIFSYLPDFRNCKYTIHEINITAGMIKKIGYFK